MVDVYVPPDLLKRKRGRPRLSEEEKARSREKRLENRRKYYAKRREPKPKKELTKLQLILGGKSVTDTNMLFGIPLDELSKKELIQVILYMKDSMLRQYVIQAKERSILLKKDIKEDDLYEEREAV